MLDKDQGQSPEQKQQIASEIYGKLQQLRGTASLDGFNVGEVIFPVNAKRIKIANLGTISELERPIFRQRGFSEEDMDSGITALIEYQFLNPDWPVATFNREPNLFYLNISGTGKVVGGDPLVKDMEKTNLNPEQLEALQKIAQLSMIPRQILEVFDSYEVFVNAVGNFDRRGIDGTEMTPIQIMYNGGLNQFVRALSLSQSGDLARLDTSLHALSDSLDKRDHFTKLFEILENLRGSDKVQN